MPVQALAQHLQRAEEADRAGSVVGQRIAGGGFEFGQRFRAVGNGGGGERPVGGRLRVGQGRPTGGGEQHRQCE
jgi:hypothetical protein